MCLALYIATARPLPTIDWDDANPAFHVVPAAENLTNLRSRLCLEHVYYVGSHEGCSCAFNYEHEYEPVLLLRRYLRNALGLVEEIHGFVCRVGAEDRPIEHWLKTSPEGVALPDFYLREGQFLAISDRTIHGQPATDTANLLFAPA